MLRATVFAAAILMGHAPGARCQDAATAAPTPSIVAPSPDWALPAAASGERRSPVESLCGQSSPTKLDEVTGCLFDAPRCSGPSQCASWCYPLNPLCQSGCCACKV